MANKYAVVSGLASAINTVWSTTDGGAANSTLDDGDTFIISAGVNVLQDIDMTAWTGLAGANTIRGGVTPGMLYNLDGTPGWTKFRTGATLVGTTSTNKGRLVGNADGVFETVTPLAYATKSVILLDGTASIDCTSLDVRHIPTEPTNLWARVYGTKYDFNAATAVDVANNIIDLGTSPPAAGTLVCVTALAGATLPTGLIEDLQCYVRVVSGNTCKLAYTDSDSAIIDITAVGSGTCTMFTGFAAGSDTVNVIEDVTGDNWTAGDAVVLCNIGQQDYDQQRLTVNTINAGTLVLSAVTDSAQKPGARVVLSSRNCSVRSSCTTNINIISGGTECKWGEIRSTAGTGITFYGYGNYSGLRNTFSTISGCYSGVSVSKQYTVNVFTGNFYCSAVGYNGITQYVIGCYVGCSTEHFSLVQNIMGTTYCVYACRFNTVINAIGNNTIFIFCSGCYVENAIGNSGVFSRGSENYIKNYIGNTRLIETPGTAYSAKGAILPSTFGWYERNINCQKFNFFSSNHAGIYGAYKIFQAFGDITKVTAGSGTPTPNRRSGGGEYLLEASNLQTNLSSINYMIFWDDDKIKQPVKIWATAGIARIYRVYAQSTFALAAGELVLKAKYYDSASDTDTATVLSTQAVSTRSSIADWSQYQEVTITPARDGFIYFDLYLYKYSAGGQVFVDPLFQIT